MSKEAKLGEAMEKIANELTLCDLKIIGAIKHLKRTNFGDSHSRVVISRNTHCREELGAKLLEIVMEISAGENLIETMKYMLDEIVAKE